MEKSDGRTSREQSQTQPLQLPLRELVREALLDTVVISGVCWPRKHGDPMALLGPVG
jgi:hypothetical protein